MIFHAFDCKITGQSFVHDDVTVGQSVHEHEKIPSMCIQYTLTGRMGDYVDSSISVIILIDFSFEFRYLLFSLPPNILHIVSKVFKIVVYLIVLVVAIIR